MKNKFALCFRPVVDETETEKENRDCNRNIVDDHHHHHHLDEAKIIESRSILNGSKRSYSFSDVNRSSTQPSTPRKDLRRRNSSSRKTAGSISTALKTLFRSSSPKVVPKGSGEFEDESEHMMGIKKNKGSKNQITYSKSSSSSSTTTTSHVTSPSSSTSSSMNSSEMNHNINEVSNLKRSMLARSNSTNKKPRGDKYNNNNNKALKSSSSYKENQEGFVFYLIILALVFNMVFGLVYAIVLTSLSLYFMGRHRSYQRPVNALKLAELRKPRRKTMLHV